MRIKLIELVSKLPIDIESDVEYVADVLIANGVTILPEGAIILTRAEIDALNKYAEKVKQETVKAVFADFKELLEERDSLEDSWARMCENPDDRGNFLYGKGLCEKLINDLNKLAERREDTE